MSVSSMYTDEVRFRIKEEHFLLVIEAMKMAGADIPQSDTLQILIKRLFGRNLGFKCYFDKDNGDLSYIWFADDKTTPNHQKYFQAIAKYVEAGSFINCRGDEWTFWQWYFNGDCMIEKPGRVVFK